MSSTANVKSSFALHEVIVLTGFSKYMLDYLAREEIFKPTDTAVSGRGRRRRYSYADIVLLRALHAICAGKGKIRHLKESLLSFRKLIGPIVPGQRLDRFLVVQGDELCMRDEGSGATGLFTSQMMLSFVVDLDEVSRVIEQCVVFDAQSLRVTLIGTAAAEAESERQRIWGPVKARRTSAY